MATSAEIGLAALGAFAASEASGVTDVTSLGRGGDRSGDEGGGNTPAGLPGLGALQAQIGGLRGAVARAGVNAPQSGDASQLDLAAAFEQAVERGAGSVDVADPNQNLTRTVEVVRDAAGGNVPSLTGGGGSGGGGGGGAGTAADPFGVLGGRLGGFDPDAAGDAFGRGVGEVVEGTVSGVARGTGEAIGSIPGAVGGGLFDSSVRTGQSVADEINDTLGVEGPTVGESLAGEGDASPTDLLPGMGPGQFPIGGIDGGITGDPDTSIFNGGATGDLADDGRLDEPLIGGGGTSSRDRDPTGGGSNAATGSTSPSIARNADEAAAGGDPAGDPDTMPSDAERDDALDDVRRAAAAGRRSIGVIR